MKRKGTAAPDRLKKSAGVVENETKRSTTNAPLPTLKMNADSPPAPTKTKTSEELDLLKTVTAESKVLRKLANENAQQPVKVQRKGVAGAAHGDQQGLGAVCSPLPLIAVAKE